MQSADKFARQDLPPMPSPDWYRLDQLPSLLDMEQVVRNLPRRKATGPSGIPNEVWKASPATAARLWLPVVLKQHVRLTEPVRFSTGILATLFKGKGDPSCVTSHRSIFLLEGLGKACRKMVRIPLLDALRSASPDLFEGCQPGSSSEVLTHYITGFRDFHHLKGRSTFCLFIDLSSAYYRVIRAKITGEDWTDAAICHVLSHPRPCSLLFGLGWMAALSPPVSPDTTGMSSELPFGLPASSFATCSASTARGRARGQVTALLTPFLPWFWLRPCRICVADWQPPVYFGISRAMRLLSSVG